MPTHSGWDDTNKLMYPPLNINSGGDIQQALASGYKDIGGAIRNGTINKWAKYKPVRSSQVGWVSRTIDITSFGFGTFPGATSFQQLLNLYNGYDAAGLIDHSSDTPDAWDNGWQYKRPRGGGSGYTEYFRFSDFVKVVGGVMQEDMPGYCAKGPNPFGTFAVTPSSASAIYGSLHIENYNKKLANGATWPDYYLSLADFNAAAPASNKFSYYGAMMLWYRGAFRTLSKYGNESKISTGGSEVAPGEGNFTLQVLFSNTAIDVSGGAGQERGLSMDYRMSPSQYFGSSWEEASLDQYGVLVVYPFLATNLPPNNSHTPSDNTDGTVSMFSYDKSSMGTLLSTLMDVTRIYPLPGAEPMLIEISGQKVNIYLYAKYIVENGTNKIQWSYKIVNRTSAAVTLTEGTVYFLLAGKPCPTGSGDIEVGYGEYMLSLTNSYGAPNGSVTVQAGAEYSSGPYKYTPTGPGGNIIQKMWLTFRFGSGLYRSSRDIMMEQGDFTDPDIGDVTDDHFFGD